MDIFKYDPNLFPDPTYLGGGEIINGLTSKLWVERYSDLGEFSLEAPLSSGLRTFLPLGTLISQIDSEEVMIVENHNIKQSQQEDPSIVVSGRTFPSFLENRVVGTDLARASSTLAPYNMPSDYACNHAVKVINDHIYTTATSDKVYGFHATTDGHMTGDQAAAERQLDIGDIWTETKKLLAIDNLGIKSIRVSGFSSLAAPRSYIHVYHGEDRTADVIFSWLSGDISLAEYLFSLKSSKNAALVKGKWIWTVVTNTPDNYDRRWMVVDGTAADESLDALPTGLTLVFVQLIQTELGQKALRNQNKITIAQTEIDQTLRYKYREDFNVGDLVTIDGNFDETAVMRITEYAEIEDENGYSGHPTLELPTPATT